jgi:predicted membrane protein
MQEFPSSDEPTRADKRRERRAALRNWRRNNSIFGGEPMRGAASPRLIVGLMIVVLGIIYLAGNLDIIDTRVPLRFIPPALFAAVGIGMLMSPSVRPDGRAVDKRWAFVWLFISAWLFAYQFHWIDIGFWDLVFPVLLLFVGARLVQRALNSPDEKSGESGQQTRAFAFLSGAELRTFTQPIKESEVMAILSGVKLDLTSAQIEGDSATLQVTAIMGGVEIYAPSDWNIVSDVLPILGAYVDKRRPTATIPTKTLHITGIVLMGGVEVKS